MERPKNTEKSKHEIFKLVNKANAVIEDAVKENSRFCHLMYIESMNEFLHFDYQGMLTREGKVNFWKELNQKMKDFDRGHIDLQPEPYRYNKFDQNNNKNQYNTGNHGNFFRY